MFTAVSTTWTYYLLVAYVCLAVKPVYKDHTGDQYTQVVFKYRFNNILRNITQMLCKIYMVLKAR